MKYWLPLLVAIPVGLLAQPASRPVLPIPPPSTSDPADTQWQKLKSLGRAAVPGANGKKATRAQEATRFVDHANQLKAFYTAYPTHASAKEAKTKEVVALALAGLNGDTTQDTRRESLLGAIRKDSTISLAQRFEAVAWSSRVAMSRQGPFDRAAKFIAEEKLTRNLIAEFPVHPVGYESLVGIARDSAAERGKRIAQDILAMPTAPLEVRAEAQRLLDRQALVGKNLKTILQETGAAKFIPADGKVVIVYSWSISLPHCRVLAKQFAQQAPQANFIGVCLDSNLKDATQGASSNKLPGQQYYNARGTMSPLAEALRIGPEAVIYIVDRGGIIRDVQGNMDLSPKVAQFRK